MLPREVRTSRTSSEVGPKFERSWVEVRTKLGRSSNGVGPKFERSWAEVRTKLGRSSNEVGPKFERIWIKLQLPSNFERSWAELQAKSEPRCLGAECIAYRCVYCFASGEETIDFV